MAGERSGSDSATDSNSALACVLWLTWCGVAGGEVWLALPPPAPPPSAPAPIPPTALPIMSPLVGDGSPDQVALATALANAAADMRLPARPLRVMALGNVTGS
eukprot:349916-Chlamydomonas_euryale.AAC.6